MTQGESNAEQGEQSDALRHSSATQETDADEQPVPAAENTGAANPINGRAGLSLPPMAAFGCAVGYLLLNVVTPRLPFSNVYLILLFTLVSLVLLLTYSAGLAQNLRTSRALAISIGVSALLVLPTILVPLYVALFAHWRSPADVPPLLRLYPHYTAALRAIPGLHGLLLITLASSVGALIARIVREFNLLLPMAVVLACVDLFVVFGPGPVSAATSGKSAVAGAAMRALTVQLPTAHPKSGAAPFPLAAGFADFLFVGLFFACFAKFGIPSRRTLFILCEVLSLYMLIVFQFALALPALVPIAAVVIGLNWRSFHYKREEAFALLYAAVIVAVVGIGLLFFLRR